MLRKVKTKGKMNTKFKAFYVPGIGLCINVHNAGMNCYRADHPGEPIDIRRAFTKSSACSAILGIKF